MPTSAGTRFSVPPFLEDADQHRRLMANWIQEANKGHLSNTGSVTLASGTSQTVVSDTRFGAMSFVSFMPTTANAAAETTLYVGTRGKQTFTITHNNAATGDRTFVYAILG